MKKIQFNALLLALTVVLTFSMSSCTKEGFGGDAKVSGTVAHHNAVIRGASVFLKFNATELPGTLATDFDASTVSDAQGNYTFENLKKGNYYLYSVGYDSSIFEVVKGGVAFEITEKDANSTTNIAVTE